MKWWAILILCILLVNPVLAESVRLFVGESYVKMGVNITLAKIDREYEKAVICVNNEKQILEDNQFTYFLNASLELADIDRHDKSVKLNIDNLFGCYGCKCVGDCLNDKCKIETVDEFGNLINAPAEVEEEPEEVVETLKIKRAKKMSVELIVGLGIFGGLIGIFLVWLLWFRKMSF